ncbi:MAG: prepilin-type N-terminal cleavage/methylation domain-containing protein [Myxococcales bacterium]|nr:prepilin-type N-terminal cleavage/methylation domain-containing protein [Myxococcales bacterium]
MKRQSGFSLIELMVSAVIMLIVVVGITNAFTTQHKTYMVVDQVSEAQQNLRAVTELIERDVRRAGYMVPRHAAVCAFDNTTGPDTLFVSKTDAIRSVFDLEDDNEDLGGDMGAPLSGVTAATNVSGNGTGVPLTRRWVDVAADGDDFAVGEGVIVANRRGDDDPVACGTITAISGNTLTVDFASTSTGAVGTNADLVAVPAHVYRVQVGASGAPNRLLRDGQLMALDVEDFQLTFFFDDDDDLVVDAGEMFATSGGTARPWELTPLSNRPNFTTLREVGINLVTSTRSDDPDTAYQLGAGEVTGNRASGLPATDGKRRRVNSARVRLRNVI